MRTIIRQGRPAGHSLPAAVTATARHLAGEYYHGTRQPRTHDLVPDRGLAMADPGQHHRRTGPFRVVITWLEKDWTE
ncbi:hypothetical protein ABGB07_31395 [Micromonosporaceae bacterium B7E4]